MAPWHLALAVLLIPSAGAPRPALHAANGVIISPLVLAVRSSTLEVAAPARGAASGLGAPACSGDVCQPRVAVPGHEPQFSSHGRRTELALTLVERSQLEPLASVARLLTRTGLRVEFAPRQLDARAVERGGWGRVVFGVHWRLDACSRPAWMTSPQS